MQPVQPISPATREYQPRMTLVIRPQAKGKPLYAIRDEATGKTVNYPSLTSAWGALDGTMLDVVV